MRALAVSLAVAVLAGAAAAAEPRTTMDQLFEALAYLLPAALDEQRFGDPAEAEAIRERLETLAASTDRLEAHARKRDLGFRFLSRSLAADVQEIRDRWSEGRTEEARYYLVQLTQNCVACHSRVPSAREFPLAEKLTARKEVAALSPRERAQLLVAVRRFDEALSVWEARFRDPRVSPVEMDIGGDFVDYLTVAIRVRRDAPRASRTFAKLAARPDVPRYLQFHLRSWIRALDELSPELSAEPSLARGRALVERASRASEFPAGRERLVTDLVASSVLLRAIEAAPGPDPALAEAYYHLGVIEARSGDSYWVPQAEFHLEAAVRTDPRGPYAERAYALLEEYLLLGFGASTDADLAPRVRTLLAELRALLDAERAPADVPGS